MIVDGKHIANILEQELKEQLKNFPQKKVCFILFGDNAASKKFIEMKSKVAIRLGIFVDIVEVPEPVSTSRAMEVVGDAIKNQYDGIVVQLPLPESVESEKILNMIPESMDIDVLGNGKKLAPVAQAVKTILDVHKIELKDKKVVIVGNGKLVGEPVSKMLSGMNVSYQVIDKDSGEVVRNKLLAEADIIVSGVGIPGMIKPEMIKEGVILIDAGTSESAGKLAGDIDPVCAEKASLMTPVPGGVGPITVVSLFKNLL